MRKQIAEEICYRFGADMRLTELGESIEIDPLGISTPSATDGEDTESVQQVSSTVEGYTSWSFLPVAEHSHASGVQAVARVGRYKALAELAQWRKEGQFIGIDRIEFLDVGFWRRDFARSSLGSLMNELALTPNGYWCRTVSCGKWS